MRTILVGVTILWASIAWAEKPFLPLSFEEGCRKAKKENKVVLIDFYTTWCGPCKMLDRTTWKDEKVRKWLGERTVPLKIDAEKNRKLSSKYKINSYPTILLLKDDGTEIDRLIGYHDPKDFLEAAGNSLSGKDSLTRAKEKVEADGKNDPMRRSQLGMTLAAKGRNKEALKEYLWCFDHGLEASPSFRGVRLSFLLTSIHQLGESYRPAIDALHERRDAAEHALMGEEMDGKKKAPKYSRSRFEAATEVAAINRELHENDRTVRIYEKRIDRGEKDSKLLGVLLEEILDDLIEARKYPVIIAGLSDPLAMVESKIESYRSIKEYEKSNRREGMPSAAGHFKKAVLDTGGKIFEALVGVKDSTRAHQVAKCLIKFNGNAATYESLIDHAATAGDTDEAEWLLKQARKKLNKDDLDELEKRARKTKAK